MADSKDVKDAKDIDTPHERSLMLGYNQTYIILEKDREEQGNEVLFRCGNWCYRGLVQFNGIRLTTEEVPIIIPALQKQQGSLRYYCTSKRLVLYLQMHFFFFFFFIYILVII